MNRVYIFVYAFIIFMAAMCMILIFLFTTPEHKADPAEYQLTIEDNYIIIKDYGRNVTKLPLDSTCELGNILIKDNE